MKEAEKKIKKKRKPKFETVMTKSAFGSSLILLGSPQTWGHTWGAALSLAVKLYGCCDEEVVIIPAPRPNSSPRNCCFYSAENGKLAVERKHELNHPLPGTQ